MGASSCHVFLLSKPHWRFSGSSCGCFKEAAEFVACTEPFAVGQPQGAALGTGVPLPPALGGDNPEHPPLLHGIPSPEGARFPNPCLESPAVAVPSVVSLQSHTCRCSPLLLLAGARSALNPSLGHVSENSAKALPPPDVSPKGSEGNIPAAAPAHHRGSSGPCSDPAASGLAPDLM